MRRALVVCLLVLAAGCAAPEEIGRLDACGELLSDENATPEACAPTPEDTTDGTVVDAPVNETPGEDAAAELPLDVPLTEPSANETPAPIASNETPVLVEANETPVLVEANETPVLVETNESPVSVEANETPVPVETNASVPASNGSVLLVTNASSGGEGTGGGVAPDTPDAPLVRAFALSRPVANNSGLDGIVVTGSVSDADGEATIAALTIRSAMPGVAPLVSTHFPSAEELAREIEPDAWGPDGMKVWGGAAGDGAISFALRLDVPHGQPAGLYATRVTVIDANGTEASSAATVLQITDFTRVQALATPVDLAGIPLVGNAWGGWAGLAGARNVTASNYLKIVNTGTDPDPRVRITFASGSFVGALDPRYQIPIAGNLELAWWEDTTPSESVPSDGVFDFTRAAPDGTADVRFTGAGNVVYVAYRFRELPPVLAIQAYGAPFSIVQEAA